MPLDDFQIVAKLGSGVYSSVYKVRRIVDDQFYALKKVKLSALNQKEKQNALNQAIILASLQHPNIIGYHQALIDEESASLCIVMQYAQQGDLLNKITKTKQKKESFEEQYIWKVLISVLNGLKRLHQKKILHRDLKSANIFISQKGNIKIGDLNVSKVSQQGLCFTQTGTPYYASPEIWKDQPYGAKSDIWSLGCVIYELICLKPPFSGDDMEDLYKSVTKGIYSRIPSNYSTDLNDILRMMLQVDPMIRPSAERLLNSSIVKKRLKQTPQLQALAMNEDKLDQNPEIITENLMKKKDIYQLGHHLPEANYNRSRVKTLHDPRQLQSKIMRSRIYLSREGFNCQYSPPSRLKKSLKQIKSRQQSISQVSSKKAQCRILCKRNNVIEMARKQVMNLESPKLKQIREKLQKQHHPIKNYQQVYMKRLIKNRTKTDTATLLKSLGSIKAKEGSKFCEKHNNQNQILKKN